MKLLKSLGLMFFIVIVGGLIGNFFDIKPYYYIPFIIWGVALCLFNIVLDQYHVNKFMPKA